MVIRKLQSSRHAEGAEPSAVDSGGPSPRKGGHMGDEALCCDLEDLKPP
jgi:hypothetical protein